MKFINFNSVFYWIQVIIIKPIHLIIVLLLCHCSRILFSVFETVAGKLLYVLLAFKKKHQQIVEWLNIPSEHFHFEWVGWKSIYSGVFQNPWWKSTIVRYYLQNKLKKIFCNWIIFFNYPLKYYSFDDQDHLSSTLIKEQCHLSIDVRNIRTLNSYLRFPILRFSFLSFPSIRNVQLFHLY